MPTDVTRRATVQHLVENALVLARPQAGDELILFAKK
jgi:hypothetical protein